MKGGRKNLRFSANTTERDGSRRLALSGECKRNIVAKMGELRYCSHGAFTHSSL